LARIQDEGHGAEGLDDALRLQMVHAGRVAIETMRRSGSIGDDAYRHVEEELDRMELAALPVDR
jgi:CPA1 family monovalent cation:H+ antiporter